MEGALVYQLSNGSWINKSSENSNQKLAQNQRATNPEITNQQVQSVKPPSYLRYNSWTYDYSELNPIKHYVLHSLNSK